MTKDEADIPVHEGGCMCGAVRYKAVGDPLSVTLCHCVNCRMNTGSAFSFNAIFAKDQVTITGTPVEYLDSGDASTVVRTFCGVCGVPIESRSIYSKDNYSVLKAGAFDHPEVLVPDTEVYCKSALPWVEPDANRKCFPALGSL